MPLITHFKNVGADQNSFFASIFNPGCRGENLTRSTILATNLAELTSLPLVVCFSGLAVDPALR